MNSSASLTLALRFALREMRSGLRGFAIFLACIALGVAAIGGVNSISRAVSGGIESEGQTLLGGDMRFELNQREASNAEFAFLNEGGAMAVSADMRSMARLEDGSDQSLVEVKAVDNAYPLYGTFTTEPPLAHDDMFGSRNGAWGAVAPDIFFSRLGLKIGDRVLLGDKPFELRGQIVTEPDLLSDGFGFAPRFMVSMEALRDSGLIRPGSLVEYRYKLKMDGGAPADVARFREEALDRFPEAGWSIRDRANAAPALSANIKRFSQFLTLVGLTALVVGGVGVGNAVRAHVASKRGVIATFKCLGASGRFAFFVYLFQIAIIAVIGIVIGLVIAALIPFAASAALADVLPLPSETAIYPDALAMAALFGALVTLLFALLPLGRARDIPATELFRSMNLSGSRLPRPIYLIAAIVLALLLGGLAVWLATDRYIAAVFIGAVIFSFIVLRLVSHAIQILARKAPTVRSAPLRLAIGNIHRPGALTPSVVLSLGLGLTLLVAIALIDGNLRQQISGNLPERAPNFFFVDIPSTQIEPFSNLISEQSPEGKLVQVPMLRGRVIALNGIDVTKIEVPPQGAWVLRGDRGITYAKRMPENSSLSEGEWWPEDYSGDPLVSFSAEEAGELGLKMGDTVTVNVLGRNITARIANLRQVEWETLAINFVMVFSPNTFAGAPHAWLATLLDSSASAEGEARILNAVTRTFPTVTSVRVKDALEIVNRVIGQIGTAIRAAAALALIASVLVLSGALAAGNQARIHDAVVLKTLGATRFTLTLAFVLEYFLIGLATALFALAAGGFASWFVISNIMTLPFTLQPVVAVTTVAAAIVLTVGFGLVGTWRILGLKAAPFLREL